ncbi:MAG: alpha/beta hydrolase [Gammaproteobacteria bacterium]|nr:alpha/beta hydrolase [Gammaproteobacteria bacterium]
MDGADERADDEPPAPVRYLHGPGGERLAYVVSAGRAPTVVFLCGYASHMGGTKARFLESRCRRRGQAYLRFDYQGHGESSGSFEQGTIGLWAEDARRVIESVTEGGLVLVGSSMGAWIMLLTGLALKHRLAGLVGVASAPDFSEDLIRPSLTPEQRARLERDGVLQVPSDYSEAPQLISRNFLDEARRHLLLRGRIPLDCPVRLIHGLDDPDVPWRTSLRLLDALASDDARLILVKGGGHRLSASGELDLIGDELDALIDRIETEPS